MSGDSPEGRTALLSASACSVELFVHKFLLFLILLPSTIFVSLFLAFHIGTSLLNFNLSADWQQWKQISRTQDSAFLSDGQETALASALTFLTLAASAIRYRRNVRQLQIEPSDTRRYLTPKGEQGKALIARIEALWRHVAQQSATPPEVLWFASAAVLARTMTRSGRPAVALSSGLWESIERDDSIAKIVLLHELAHIAYGDPRTFIRLKAVLDGAAWTLAQVFRVLTFIILFLITHQFIANYRTHLGTGPIIRQTLMIAGTGLLALSIVPVSVAMIRRYLGVITSLMELRADVRSAQWTGSLDRFAEILSNHPLVHESTLRDRARSWFSLGLTHLSESERVEIVRNPERLLTPKVQYFFLSLIMVLLLPLNGLRPVFEGGIVDLAAVVTVAAALCIAVTTMLVLAGGTATRISLGRLLAISLCVVFFTAACQINLYTFTYSLSTVAVRIGFPARGATSVPSEFLADTASAFHDVGGQFLNIWSGGWVVLSVVVTTAALGGMLIGARRLRRFAAPSPWLLAVVAVSTGFGVVVDGYDPWRAFTIEHTLFGRGIVAWADLSAHVPGIRFTLGPCLALAAVLVSLAFRSWSGGDKEAHSMTAVR